MKTFVLASTMLAALASPGLAADPPEWMKAIVPPQALSDAWQEHQNVFMKGDLPSKTKYLIGIGVAAQIPCVYCIVGQTASARAAGATDEEIKEAIAAAALTRKWSTMLNGNEYPMDKFRAQLPGGKPTN